MMRTALTTSVLGAAALAFVALSSAAFAQTAPAPAQAASSAKHQRHGEKMQKLDINKDGNISREEAKGRARLEKNFDAIDSNKDGQLSRDELKAARQAHKGKEAAPR